jgi:hypothetical protein
MAESVRRLDYFVINVANKRGEGARVLQALAQEGVNLLAFTGFPGASGKAQLDFVPEDGAAFRAAAERLKLRPRGPKTVFLIEGEDRAGAVGALLARLAEARINVTAIDALAAGSGRYCAMLWVKPKDVDQAAAVLRAA